MDKKPGSQQDAGLITSFSNPKIKGVRALKRRKQRAASSEFLVEGIHHVGEALAAAQTRLANGVETVVEAIYYAPDLLTSPYAHNLIEEQSGRGIPCYATSAAVFASLAGKENPQGILAVAHQRQARLQELDPQGFSWGVALVAPQDPGNIGTILRAIDAVGGSGLLLLDDDGGPRSVDPTHPSAVRASLGALFWYPVVRASFTDFAVWAQRHAYHVYGTSAHGSCDYRQVAAYQRPLILLMGSEREGLTPAQAGVCQALVRLPMLGRASSLNLAVATGVMLYDMLDKLDLPAPDPLPAPEAPAAAAPLPAEAGGSYCSKTCPLTPPGL
jgi:TrmH family RNA methyltransferase